jgi:hypothetical protein
MEEHCTSNQSPSSPGRCADHLDVETSIGTLKFNDGAPLPETAEKLHDYLDTLRGVDAFLKGIPGASLTMLLDGMDSIGTKEAHQIPIWYTL